MDDWRWFAIGAMLGLGLHFLHKIYLEIRSIRLMMNDDRRISNEVTQFDD